MNDDLPLDDWRFFCKKAEAELELLKALHARLRKAALPFIECWESPATAPSPGMLRRGIMRAEAIQALRAALAEEGEPK